MNSLFDGMNKFTSGDFVDEDAAWTAFDDLVERSRLFHVYKEVEGEYIQPRPETESKGARIDRILVPLPRIIERGWKKGGAIGVEGKRSGKKIGTLVAQAIDYSRCGFRLELPNHNGLIALVMLRWVFVYPVDAIGGDLASLMAQNRIGTCSIRNGDLVFSCNGTNAIKIISNGSFEAKDLDMGNKRGSR